MTLFHIAVRNMLRRKAKALFVLAGIVIGVATVVAVTDFSKAITANINHKMEKYGANILIVPQTESLSLSYGGFSLGGVSVEMKELHAGDLNQIPTIRNYGNIAAVGPMVIGGVKVNTQQVLLAGVDFNSTAVLKPWWKVDGKIPQTEEFLLGSESARIFGAKPGDRLYVDRKAFTVSGILQPTGSQDDGLIFTRLPAAQAVLNKSDRISMVEVAALCTGCPIDDMVAQLSEAIPGAKVMPISQVVKGRMETIAQFKTFSYIISALVMFVGSLVVLVTMMGSVRERTEEIGIFRAIGYRRKHVMKIVFQEALMISAAAGIIGFLAGTAISWGALQWLTDHKETIFSLNYALAAIAVGLSMAVGLLASAYPAFMASRMDPNDALRAI